MFQNKHDIQKKTTKTKQNLIVLFAETKAEIRNKYKP